MDLVNEWTYIRSTGYAKFLKLFQVLFSCSEKCSCSRFLIFGILFWCEYFSRLIYHYDMRLVRIRHGCDFFSCWLPSVAVPVLKRLWLLKAFEINWWHNFNLTNPERKKRKSVGFLSVICKNSGHFR